MRIIKRIALLLLGVLVLALIVAAFMPKHFAYERSTDITAPKEVVFGIANDLKSQETWGPWKKQDPTIQNTYNEIASGVGQKTTWTSTGGSGNGTQTITESTPPSAIKYKIEFEDQGGGDSSMKFEDSEGGTKTTWAFSYDVPYPFNLMAAMMGGSMNKMLEDGLAGLKEMAEKKAAEAPTTTGKYDVKMTDFPGKTYVGIREQTTHDEVMKPSFFGDRFGKIMTLLTKSKMPPAGSPSGIYYTWDLEKKTTDVAVAIPVAKGTAVAGGSLKTFEVPASKAVMVDYYGPYDNFQEVHTAIGDYIKANGLKEKAPVIEEYVTDPGTEKDSTKWLTKIIYMIEGN